eukprot:c13367_g1_i1 orf=1-156(-)
MTSEQQFPHLPPPSHSFNPVCIMFVHQSFHPIVLHDQRPLFRPSHFPIFDKH